MDTTPTSQHSVRTAPEPGELPGPPSGAPALEASADRQPLRRDGDLLLTGRAEFVADIAPRGLMHAAILRSPHPHARIRGMNTSRARARPDVEVVLTGAEALELAGPLPHFFEPSLVGCKTTEFHCLATDRVRWVGEPVAAVVANSLADAEAALADIEVDYEPLPAVLDAEDALRDDAPVLFEEWGDNRLGAFPFAEGDAAGKIATAPHVVRDELRVGRQHVAPMETRGYVAQWEPGERLTLWASTQNPHPLRTNLAVTLGVPEDRIRVVATRMGGGFGHKFNGYGEESLVCLLSRLADAPVKWVETRKDCLLVGAREYIHHFEVGFDDDGVVLGLTDRILGNVGCLATWGGWGMTFQAAMTFPGPYRVANYSVESVPVVTNKAPWNGFRGYGKEQTAMALERMMDRIAEHLELDPAEVRRRNFIPPEAFPFWTAAKHLDSGEYAGALDKALALADYDALRERQRTALAQGRYLGVGIGFELTPEGGDLAGNFVRGYDTSTVRVYPSGAVSVLTGVTSPGTGNETSIAYLVAREFGLPIENIGVSQGDTDVCPYGFGNFTGRSLATGGGAAVLAARELKERMAAAAATLLKADAETLEFREGTVTSLTHPKASLSFAELADTIYRHGLASPGIDQPLLEVTRIELPHNIHHVPDEQGRSSVYPSFPYSAHIALVEIDIETGVVEVAEYSAIDDCGVVISPAFVAGQLYGAIAQGIGGALWEEVPYGEDGAPAAETFKHYLTPRAPDLPSFRLAHQHTPSPFTLLGTKGAGESGVAGAMSAILNAVNDGLRPLEVRTHQVPLTPPVVLDAIVSGGAL